MAECRAINDRVQHLMQPVGPDGVYVALQPCLILFGAPDLNDARGDLLGAWISIYQAALQDQPKESLEYAISDWIANGKPFFPKPTELRARAVKHAAAIGQLAWRCRKVAEAAAEHNRAEETPEERERGLALVRETLAAVRGGNGLSGLPRPAQTRSRAEVAEELRRAAQ